MKKSDFQVSTVLIMHVYSMYSTVYTEVGGGEFCNPLLYESFRIF